MGFYHRKVTPEHAQTNGEAQSFMKVLNNMEQSCPLQKSGRNKALQERLMDYRATPHPATNVTPYEALMHRKVRIMMDTMKYKAQDDNIEENGAECKKKSKRKKENRKTKEHSFIVGDYILLKQQKRKKENRNTKEHSFIVGDYILLKQQKRNK